MIFAYFGPETFLPVTSIIATAIGFFMMFGRRSLRLLGSFFVFNRAREPRTPAVRKPHTQPANGAPSSNERVA